MSPSPFTLAEYSCIFYIPWILFFCHCHASVSSQALLLSSFVAMHSFELKWTECFMKQVSATSGRRFPTAFIFEISHTLMLYNRLPVRPSLRIYQMLLKFTLIETAFGKRKHHPKIGKVIRVELTVSPALQNLRTFRLLKIVSYYQSAPTQNIPLLFHSFSTLLFHFIRYVFKIQRALCTTHYFDIDSLNISYPETTTSFDLGTLKMPKTFSV